MCGSTKYRLHLKCRDLISFSIFWYEGDLPNLSMLRMWTEQKNHFTDGHKVNFTFTGMVLETKGNKPHHFRLLLLYAVICIHTMIYIKLSAWYLCGNSSETTWYNQTCCYLKYKNQTLLHQSYKLDANFLLRSIHMTDVQLCLYLVYFSNSLNTYNHLPLLNPLCCFAVYHPKKKKKDRCFMNSLLYLVL